MVNYCGKVTPSTAPTWLVIYAPQALEEEANVITKRWRKATIYERRQT